MKVVYVLICLALGGCATAEQLAAEDDAKCTAYGANHGSPAYVQCRSQLDAARTQASATAIAGMNAANSRPSYQPPPPICVGGIC
jgi:hypothetical protein